MGLLYGDIDIMIEQENQSDRTAVKANTNDREGTICYKNIKIKLICN